MLRPTAIAAAVLSFVAGGSVSLAQFGSDPAALPAVSNAPGEQTLSKVVAAPDGGFYVCWNDAATGYDVYLQRYNAAGVAQWAENGVLVGDRTLIGVSGDYELRVDGSGNAFLAFPQDATNTRLVKMTPAGTVAWSSIVSPDATNKIGARMALLSDGFIAVGWIEGTGFKVRRVAADGTPSGDPLTVTEAGRSLSICDLQAGDNGSVIVLWVRPFGGGTSSRYLRTQKYDAALAPVWTDAAPGSPGLIIYQPSPGEAWPLGGGTYNATQGGSIQLGYFPLFVSDGAGGGVYGWYENAGPRAAYVQHVSAAGVRRWETNWGLPVTSVNNGYKLSGSVAYDAVGGDIFMSWLSSNAAQNQWGVGAQKVDASGLLAWGAGGVEVAALDPNQEAFVQTVVGPEGGCYVTRFEGRAVAGISVSGVVQATRIGSAGDLLWSPTTVEVCSDTSAKGRLWSAPTANGGVVMTFTNGSGASSDLLLANARRGGQQGICPGDFGSQGGQVEPDGSLNNNDFIAFIDLFFASDTRADIGAQGGVPGVDGSFNNNDFIVFIDRFFEGC